MSAITDYSQPEMDKILAAPMVVSMYVMGSSLSGPIGLVKEMMAGVDTAMKAGKNAAPGSLFSALWSEQNLRAQQDKIQQETQESTAGAQNMDQAKAKMLDDVKGAVAIMSSKAAPDELAAYKKLIMDVATNVADAAKEGGFMGIGGVQVNSAEKQAMSDIQAVVA